MVFNSSCNSIIGSSKWEMARYQGYGYGFSSLPQDRCIVMHGQNHLGADSGMEKLIDTVFPNLANNYTDRVNRLDQEPYTGSKKHGR